MVRSQQSSAGYALAQAETGVSLLRGALEGRIDPVPNDLFSLLMDRAPAPTPNCRAPASRWNGSAGCRRSSSMRRVTALAPRPCCWRTIADGRECWKRPGSTVAGENICWIGWLWRVRHERSLATAGGRDRLDRRATGFPGREGVLYRQAFAPAESARLFAALHRETAWQQPVIVLYGRSINSPRLSAWHGDPDAVYRYSGLRLEPMPWTPTLLDMRERVEALAVARFNSVLLNLYRDGQDSMGWHSDDEPELGRNPVIASISLGARRRFLLQHKKRRLRLEWSLEDGDMLVLGGTTQHYWRHHVPKTRPTGGAANQPNVSLDSQPWEAILLFGQASIGYS